MKKRSLFIIAFILALLFANSMTRLEYDMSLYDYLITDSSLTDEEIEYLKDNSSLIYGADYNSPPLRYVNQDTQQYEGLTIDYLNALSIELGTTIDFKPMAWSEALNALESGETDICDMYKSDERSKKFLFTNPIYYQRGAILVKKDNTVITSIEDLEGKTIAGNKGDFIFEYIEEEFNNVTGIEADDLQAAIQLLVEGKIDAVLGDESVMYHFITKSELKNEYIILEDYLYEREAVLAVSKDNAPLISILNKGISNLNKKKTMDMIYQKWFGLSPLITKGDNADKNMLIIRYSLALIGLFILGLYTWNLQLKNMVKQRTDDLRLSNNELETVFNGLTSLMLVIDDSCIVQDANTAFCNIYGESNGDMKHKHCHDIEGILGTDCDSCIIKKTFQSNVSLNQEIKHRDRIYRVNTYTLEKLEHTKHRILLVMEDITDFKLTERKMLQSTKMAAVGQLAAGVAHEIRTPLGIIRNNCYYIKRSPDEEEKASSITTIEKSVDRANNIIDNLLNFSRLTDNTVTETDIKDLIMNIYDLNRKSLESKKIKFNILCDDNVFIELNSESLKHVLINLINNAIDAMPDGGEIEIKVANYDDKISLSISDTGMGMDEKTQEDIFNPFFTTKDPGSGTGLGLYITYNEVEKMNGTINLESEINKGSCFTIQVPRPKGSMKEVN